jgi:hypothetical protein
MVQRQDWRTTSSDDLILDWDRLPGLAHEWERQQRRFCEEWRRRFPDGPRWENIMEYHRYGYAARKLYPDESSDDVIERTRHGFERGDWETRDPWPTIEIALREGWNEANRGS